MGDRKDSYKEIIFNSVPRLLSLLDRDSSSQTYGSFDRQHWAWANKDFVNADFQRGVYILAILFTEEFPWNKYYNNENVLKWISAGFDYWAKIQHKNGSFDQWYPQEGSVGTTGFTLCALSEAFVLIQEKIPGEQKERLLVAFDKAANFICRHRETHGLISNHLAGMALALLNASNILNNNKYLKESNKLLQRIFKGQSAEGWYSEYNGADPGYETLGIAYLAKYWKKTQDPQLFLSLKRSMDYLVHFVHPDGTLGGEYGSRSTELYYPSGMEILKPALPQAEYIADKMIVGIREGCAVSPSTVDVFNFMPLLSSYLDAYKNLEPEMSENINGIKLDNFKYFDKSKMAVWTTDKIKLIIGLAKGGVMRCYKNDGTLLYSDCGYIAYLRNGSKISSQFLDYNNDCQVNEVSSCLERYFSYVPGHQMTPMFYVLLRIFSLTAGRYNRIGNWAKNLLASRLIRYKKIAPLKIIRSVQISGDRLLIKDYLKIEGKIKLKELARKSKFSTIFMGSARYFNPQELCQEDEQINNQQLKQLNNQGFLELVKEVSLTGGRTQRFTEHARLSKFQ